MKTDKGQLATPGIDTHVLQSALLRCGISGVGVHQLIEGLPVGSPEDRRMLRRLLLELLQAPGAALSLKTIKLQ